MRARRPSTRFSHVPHFPSSQLNLIGARAARTTFFKGWLGNACTICVPIVTGTNFFDSLSVSSSKASFLNASKIPGRAVRGNRGTVECTKPLVAARQKNQTLQCSSIFYIAIFKYRQKKWAQANRSNAISR